MQLWSFAAPARLRQSAGCSHIGAQVCGFSGTNDTRWLLPFAVETQRAEGAATLATDADNIATLLTPGKTWKVMLLADPGREGRRRRRQRYRQRRRQHRLRGDTEQVAPGVGANGGSTGDATEQVAFEAGADYQTGSNSGGDSAVIDMSSSGTVVSTIAADADDAEDTPAQGDCSSSGRAAVGHVAQSGSRSDGQGQDGDGGMAEDDTGPDSGGQQSTRLPAGDARNGDGLGAAVADAGKLQDVAAAEVAVNGLSDREGTGRKLLRRVLDMGVQALIDAGVSRRSTVRVHSHFVTIPISAVLQTLLSWSRCNHCQCCSTDFR